MKTKKLAACLILAFLFTAGCVWGDYREEKCVGDVLMECQGKQGCEVLADCRKESGVGCIMGDEFDEGAECGQADPICEPPAKWQVCVSVTQVGNCSEKKGGILTEISECSPGEVCYEGECFIEE